MRSRRPQQIAKRQRTSFRFVFYRKISEQLDSTATKRIFIRNSIFYQKLKLKTQKFTSVAFPAKIAKPVPVNVAELQIAFRISRNTICRNFWSFIEILASKLQSALMRTIPGHFQARAQVAATSYRFQVDQSVGSAATMPCRFLVVAVDWRAAIVPMPRLCRRQRKRRLRRTSCQRADNRNWLTLL